MQINISQKGITESIASACYFLQKGQISTQNLVAIVDIGGGSTEIAFWKEKELLWQDSVKYAGNDLLELTPKLVEAVVRDNAISEGEKINLFTMFKMDWPFIHPTWDNKLLEKLDNLDFRKEVLFNIGIFFSSICYYLGLHLRNKVDKEKIVMVAFAGNGIKFLEIITRGNEINEKFLGKNWIELFKEAIIKCHNIPNIYQNNPNIEFVFSTEPKFEVAKGLLYENIDNYKDKSNEAVKLFGIKFKFNNKKYSEFDWDDKINASEFATSCRDRNYSLVNEFIQFFNEKFKNILPINDTSNISVFNKDLDRELNKVLENRGQKELACSLSLEAIKVYAKSVKKMKLNNNLIRDEKIYVELNAEKKTIKKVDYRDKYYLKYKSSNEYNLFVRDERLNKEPTMGNDRVFKEYFEIEKDITFSNQKRIRYILNQPTVIKVNWFDDEKGEFEILNKGKLKYFYE